MQSKKKDKKVEGILRGGRKGKGKSKVSGMKVSVADNRMEQCTGK